MTHRDGCTLCKQYTKHAEVVLGTWRVEKPSHQIELTFWTVGPHVVACIEDYALDETHGKLSLYHDWYHHVIKNTKSLQEQLDSEKECHCKVESELHHLQKEGKGKGKQREFSATCEWHEWESITDCDIAEQMLSKTARKWQCHNTGKLDVLPGGMIAFPNTEPMEVSLYTVLYPVGWEKQALETMVPAVTIVPLSTLAAL